MAKIIKGEKLVIKIGDTVVPVHSFTIDPDEGASIEWLKQQMECAIEFESYERAAVLRDKIKKREQNET
jgi:protein-arginine kinase activator protein McsA